MPHVETPDDLAEDIANMVGAYGACAAILGEACAGKCRPHFVAEMKERIRQAVANEAKLAAPESGAPAPSAPPVGGC